MWFALGALALSVFLSTTFVLLFSPQSAKVDLVEARVDERLDEADREHESLRNLYFELDVRVRNLENA